MIKHNNGVTSVREAWEDEIFAMHRWGRFAFWFKTDNSRGTEEHARLKKLWEAAQPMDELSMVIIDQIRALEICNWNLEESILELCSAIGKKIPTSLIIGHMGSVSEQRWEKVWAYYLTLRNWLVGMSGGYQMLLKVCDSDKTIQNYIVGMLGERNELKKLYVERFCLVLERWLSDFSSIESVQMKAHNAAIAEVEKEIKKLDPKHQIVPEVMLKSDGDGRLQPCNHKAFRRYDMIISSIGAGKWGVVMPVRGTDGFERAAILEKYLLSIESWTHGQGKQRKDEENELFDRIYGLLGKSDNTKLFLASLLVSLLRSQQLAARKLAESRTKE